MTYMYYVGLLCHTDRVKCRVLSLYVIQYRLPYNFHSLSHALSSIHITITRLQGGT